MATTSLSQLSSGVNPPVILSPLDGSSLQPTNDELKTRTQANINKHMDQIKAEIVKEAKKQGYKISKKDVKSVRFKKLKNIKYDIFDINLDKFVITDPKDMIWLDGMTWTNNGPGEGERELRVNESTEDTYNWQITAGFTYEYQQSQEFTLYSPAGGSIKNSFKFSFNFQASYGQASKTAHGWVNEFRQKIPPYSAIRMEVKGVQFVGYVPFTIKARATGAAHCECVVQYWGKHSREFDIDLPRILNEKERTFISTGKIDGVQGYDWDVKTFEPVELTAEEKQRLPKGISEHHLLPPTLTFSAEEALEETAAET